MKSLYFILSLAFLMTSISFAQTTTDYHKNEFSVGYVYRQPVGETDTRIVSYSNGSAIIAGTSSQIKSTINSQGFFIAFTRNFNRYVGVKGEFSRTTYRETDLITIPPSLPTPTIRINNSLNNVLAGVQVKDNSKEKQFKPFVQALFGVGFESKKSECVSSQPLPSFCSDLSDISRKAFSGSFGGGLDIKLVEKVDFRAVQLDYNPMKLINGNSKKYRLGVGFVFH